ncbi:MAG TPA: hypothetical protein VFD17_03540, partial [Clostridia bacterium]|nr:hypothetical protein [Clostridia bacterium]
MKDSCRGDLWSPLDKALYPGTIVKKWRQKMIDRLIDKITEKQNPTVVGLDPRLEMVPQFMRERYFNEYGKTPK